MLRKSTKEIIDTFQSAVTNYNVSCHSFWGGGNPGQDGIERKTDFLMVLGSSSKDSPEGVIKKIFEFYKKESLILVNGASTQTSRLMDNIEQALFKLFDVEEKACSYSNVYEGNRKLSDEIARRRLELVKKVSTFICIDLTYHPSVVKMHNSL